MPVLKMVSMIYIALMLIYFMSLDCKTKDGSESVGFKILSLLQAGVLAYMIMN